MNDDHADGPLLNRPPTATQTKEALAALWANIVREYVAEHARHAAAYPHPPASRTTLAQELAWLESVRDVERASLFRVGHAEFFWGAARGETLFELGKEAVRLGGEGDGGGEGGERGVGVRVRKGFGELMGRVEAEAKVGADGGRGWTVGVVSVNWSGQFIQGVVAAGCGGRQRTAAGMIVLSNWVEESEGQVEGPGEIGREPLVTAGDKLRAMQHYIRDYGKDGEAVVYVGDSPTDLACLVEADLGVVMADDGASKLLETLKRIGFEVPHVGEAGKESRLVWAKDFEEVLRSGVVDRIKKRPVS